MRILVVHSRYQSGDASGENRVVSDEVRLLREAGHEVSAWTPEPLSHTIADRGLLGIHAIWSRAARVRIARELRRLQPQVIHAHNLFPMLSPTVLRGHPGVATVVSLHNYRLLCIRADFLRDGQPCEDCLGATPWRGVAHRCFRGSAIASGSLGASLSLHRALGSFGCVDRFLAVGQFVREKHLAAGFDPERLLVKRNFTWEAPLRTGPGRHYLYAGRLSPEKGVSTLIAGWSDSLGKLVIAGDGTERATLEARAPGSVEFTGHVSPSRVQELLTDARALILPSVCYEAAPRSVIEAFAAGVPVIASDTPPVSELFGSADCGILVAAGDPHALREAMRSLANDDRSRELGGRARERWARRHSPGLATLALESAYAEAIESAARRRSAHRNPRPRPPQDPHELRPAGAAQTQTGAEV